MNSHWTSKMKDCFLFSKGNKNVVTIILVLLVLSRAVSHSVYSPHTFLVCLLFLLSLPFSHFPSFSLTCHTGVSLSLSLFYPPPLSLNFFLLSFFSLFYSLFQSLSFSFLLSLSLGFSLSLSCHPFLSHSILVFFSLSLSYTVFF